MNSNTKNIMDVDSKTQLKIIAQYEAIRLTGQYNMRDFLSVQRQAFENEFYDFVRFTNNDGGAYASILSNYTELKKRLSNKVTPVAKKLVMRYELEK